ncbi:MAG: phage holin family protein, partial [Flavobacteriales bacterium]
MKFLIQLLLNAAVIYLGAMILPGVEVVDHWTALIVAIVLGVLNTF